MSKLNRFLQSFDEGEKPKIEKQEETKEVKAEAKPLKLQKPAETLPENVKVAEEQKALPIVQKTELPAKKEEQLEPPKLKLNFVTNPSAIPSHQTVAIDTVIDVASTSSTEEKISLSNKEEDSSNSVADDEQTPDILFQKSGTPLGLKEEWMKLYNQAQASTKKTKTTKKFKDGKFRITSDGDTEILPEFETLNKTSKQLLNQQWQVSFE